MPPPDALTNLDVIEVEDSVPKQWSVRADLWTKEEGRSDLTLELTLLSDGGGLVAEIDNIHVL